MAQGQKAPKVTDWTTLKGKFFHTFDEEGYVQYQGRIIDFVNDEIAIVQYFDWIMGQPSTIRAVWLQDIVDRDWALYSSNKAMRDAYDGHLVRRRYEIGTSERNGLEEPKQILPPLKNTPPKHKLSPHISSLLEQTNLDIRPQTIIELADTIQKDLQHGYELLLDIDKGIGGVGLHNVDKQEGDRLTGVYRIEFRGLFRPIQYVYQRLGENNLVWTARTIVMNSCLHVENAVKHRFQIHEGERSSLGVLLGSKPAVRNTLDAPFHKMLLSLNKTIYNKNKHTIEHVEIDAHDYSPADAIAIYLICRWAGVKLLEPTGLFNNWKRD